MATYSMPQLDQVKAREFNQARFIRLWNANQVVWLQINQDIMCVSFDTYKQALSTVLQQHVNLCGMSAADSESLLCKVSNTIPDSDKKFVEDFINMFLGVEETKVVRV